MTDKPIIVECGHHDADACVIWLHGLGADGYDFEPIVEQLELPDELCVRFVFPHAPMRPVTINNGYVMRAWYDILGMDIADRQDEAGIRESQQYLHDLIEQQVYSGFASERIVLAGFSQGGAIILHTGLRYDKPLAGLMGLSTYLPLSDQLEQEQSAENRRVPVFLAHGDSDPVVPPELAYRTRSRLEQQYYPIEWKEYAGMQHSVCMEEIVDISRWLQTVLSPQP